MSPRGVTPDAVPAPHVDRVRHRLEGIKGDAYRQDDVDQERRCVDSHRVEQKHGIFSEEVEVLEEPEDAQVNRYAQNQEAAANPIAIATVNPLGTVEVDYC